jgi:hypothetical protein
MLLLLLGEGQCLVGVGQGRSGSRVGRRPPWHPLLLPQQQ